jgi:hypothetical protein
MAICKFAEGAWTVTTDRRVMDTARRWVLDLGHKWVPEPGLRRLAHAAALPEEMAIVDDSDLRSFGHPRFGRRLSPITQASCPGHPGSLSISCLDLGAVIHADA